MQAQLLQFNQDLCLMGLFTYYTPEFYSLSEKDQFLRYYALQPEEG